MPRSITRKRNSGRRQRGAVAVIVGLTLAVLIGFAGLALDLGKLFVAKTELQNGADACALAASRELTGTNASQLAIAEAAGITTGARNRVLFQSEPVAVQLDGSVEFSPTLNGAYEPKSSLAGSELLMKFARCTVNRVGIVNWFIQVLNVVPGVNILPQTVGATAVATLAPAQTNCALPVSICGSALPAKPVGSWLEGAIGPPGGGGLTGNFKWIDFTPPAGGASELGATLTGSGTCTIPSVGAEVGQPGNVASVADDWNSRFGMYFGATKPGEAIPDFTGHAYTEINWPSKANAYNDFVAQRTANAPYQGDAGTGLNTKGSVESNTFLKANGADRRLAIVPVVDCAGFATGSTAPVQSWACILMLHPINNSSGGGGGGGGKGAAPAVGTGANRMFLEYLGAANNPASPCATLGLPGAAGSAGPLVPVLVQ
jgi:hypothetical protein